MLWAWLVFYKPDLYGYEAESEFQIANDDVLDVVTAQAYQIVGAVDREALAKDRAHKVAAKAGAKREQVARAFPPSQYDDYDEDGDPNDEDHLISR